jgi:hypothetical protein
LVSRFVILFLPIIFYLWFLEGVVHNKRCWTVVPHALHGRCTVPNGPNGRNGLIARSPYFTVSTRSCNAWNRIDSYQLYLLHLLRSI